MADSVIISLAFPPKAATSTVGIAEAAAVGLESVGPTQATSPRIVVLSATASRMEPYMVHVRLDGTDQADTWTMNETLASVGDWSSCNVSWDFGESGQWLVDDPRPGKTGTFDLATDQRGWNACYLYTTAGLKTITVTVWNEDGTSGQGTEQVTVVADTRAVSYVSSTGSDSGLGTEADPWLTLDKAVAEANASGATKIHLARGETIQSTRPTLTADNVWITGYGASAQQPILTSSTTGLLIVNSENLVVQNIRCDATGDITQNAFNCDANTAYNASFVNLRTNSTKAGTNRFKHFIEWDGDETQNLGSGLCVQNLLVDDAGFAGGLERNHVFFKNLQDACFLGGHYGGSNSSHIFLNTTFDDPTDEGLKRAKWEFVRVQPFETGANQTMYFGTGMWLFMSRCSLESVQTTRLGANSGVFNWFVAENCYLSHTVSDGIAACIFNHGIQYVTIRSNVFDLRNHFSLYVSASRKSSESEADATYNDIVMTRILNNTFITGSSNTDDRPTFQTTCRAEGGTLGWFAFNGLYHNNNLTVCGGTVSRLRSDLPDTYFDESKNNVYPTLGEITFLSGEGAQANLSLTEWQAKAYAINETSENLSINDFVISPFTFYCPAGSTADTHAVPADGPGCRWDYNGNVRDTAAASWSAGAAEGAFRP